MSVIATIEVPADDFTLGGVLTPDSSIRIRLERIIPMGNSFMPYVWISNESLEGLAETLEQEADITSVQELDTVNGETLVRIVWAENIDGFVTAIMQSDGKILNAIAEHETWTFQLRFDTHDDLTAFYHHCVDAGIPVDLQSVHNPGLPQAAGLGLGLTDAQRETLLYALEAGYFEVPRRVNLTDLSEDLGVSDTAISQRLRRGISSLLRVTLSESSPPDDE